MPNVTTATTTDRLKNWFTKTFGFGTDEVHIDTKKKNPIQGSPIQIEGDMFKMGPQRAVIQIRGGIGNAFGALSILSSVMAEALDVIDGTRGGDTHIRPRVTEAMLRSPEIRFEPAEGSGALGVNAVHLIEKMLTGRIGDSTMYEASLAELIESPVDLVSIQDMLEPFGVTFAMDDQAIAVMMFITCLKLYADPDLLLGAIIAKDHAWWDEAAAQSGK